MSAPKSINIFWFKRDLRLQDNEALAAALSASEPVLLLYIYEPSLWENPHYSDRHKYFIQESLLELQSDLKPLQLQLLCIQSEVLPLFELLRSHFRIATVFSTRETGLDCTYKRDQAFAQFCTHHKISWKEYQNNGILRAIKNRNTWRAAWYAYMKAPLAVIENSALDAAAFVPRELLNAFESFALESPEHPFQKGGRRTYNRYKEDFFNERLAYYRAYISKPYKSHYGCSRLSPYISWGVCSIREVYQEAQEIKKTSKHTRDIVAFTSRLRWQSHFIQKFESEPRMEFEAINKGFLNLSQPANEAYITAWKTGKTGYPLVDASIRCVQSTGYLNFRMRSMIVSFLTHHLFQHFTTGSAWLARQFLDLEPGIHYGQFQMQAGLTGTNTVRVYNPTKNAKDHDAEAIFIKRWVPELQPLPTALAIEPWNITAMEAVLYSFELGKEYPKPIVDISQTRNEAVTKLYGQRKSDLAKAERLRILELHTIRKDTDKDDATNI